jgi:hypothetical protein
MGGKLPAKVLSAGLRQPTKFSCFVQRFIELTSMEFKDFVSEKLD